MVEIAKCDGLKKTFDDSDFILEGISFSIKSREILFIYGGNGSGKSTLIKLIAGNEDLDDGVISLHEPFKNFGVYIPQNLNEIISGTAKIKELLNIANKQKEKDINKNNKILSKYNKEKLISEFSGGEQKYFFGIILISERPQLLLLDETFSSLDIKHTDEYWNIISQKVLNGSCAIIVSHDLLFIFDHFTANTSILLLKDGKMKGFVNDKGENFEEYCSKIRGMLG